MTPIQIPAGFMVSDELESVQESVPITHTNAIDEPTPTPVAQPQQAASTVPLGGTTVSFITTLEKDLNVAENWVKTAAADVEKVLTKVQGAEPAILTATSAVVTNVEAFLAAATPAVAGEGLNFPADSVAYASFLTLWKSFEALGAAVKSL